MKNAALNYATRGWRVLPLWWVTPNGCACGQGDCPSPAKHPIGTLAPRGVHSASVDPEVIGAWWTEHPAANIGLAMGQESGLWALDVDPRHGGEVTLEEMEARSGPLPTSLRQQTGSGGFHVIFQHPRDGRIPNTAGRLGAGLDVRGDGGYIVAAPSRHISGGEYVWLDEEATILESAPPWLLAMLGERYDDDVAEGEDGEPLDDAAAHVVAKRKMARAVSRIREGLSRHQTAVWLWQQLRDNRVPRPVALELMEPLLAVANERGDTRKFTRTEATRALAWAYRRRPRTADVPVVVANDSVQEIAAIDSEVERFRRAREMARTAGVPVAVIRREVESLRAPDLDDDDWRSDLLWKETQRGRVLEPCLRNVQVILSRHPEWVGRIRYDEFAGEINLGVGSPITSPPGRWTDEHASSVAGWLQAVMRLMVTPLIVHQAVPLAAQNAPYHPVREYLGALEWDGEPRLDSWLEDLAGVKRTAVTCAMGRRFLVSAVARVLQPGCKVDHALVLEGAQNLGKSTLMKTLFDPWFTDEIDVLGSRESTMQLRGVWCIEIAEMDAMHRSEVSRVKAFLTRRDDRYRPPYGRSVTVWPRQVVFCGSTNKDEYLTDDTGNRRFWTVKATDIDLEAAANAKDQLWAEAYVAFRRGERWWLDTEDLQSAAETEQEERYHEDSWEERIAHVLEPANWLRIHGSSDAAVTVGRVLSAIGLDTAHQGRADQVRAAAALRRLGRVRVVYERAGVRVREWFPRGVDPYAVRRRRDGGDGGDGGPL